MAIDFSKFDEQVDTTQLAKDVDEAAKNGGGDFPVVPAGLYTIKLEKLELGTTKDNRPMLKGQFKIKDGTYMIVIKRIINTLSVSSELNKL